MLHCVVFFLYTTRFLCQSFSRDQTGKTKQLTFQMFLGSKCKPGWVCNEWQQKKKRRRRSEKREGGGRGGGEQDERNVPHYWRLGRQQLCMDWPQQQQQRQQRGHSYYAVFPFSRPTEWQRKVQKKKRGHILDVCDSWSTKCEAGRRRREAFRERVCLCLWVRGQSASWGGAARSLHSVMHCGRAGLLADVITLWGKNESPSLKENLFEIQRKQRLLWYVPFFKYYLINQ